MFSIVSFATTVDFTGQMNVVCTNYTMYTHNYNYPFHIEFNQNFGNCVSTLNVNFSSDAKFYVCTGVLAMLYSIAIIIIYIKFDDLYRRNEKVPLAVSNLTGIQGIRDLKF